MFNSLYNFESVGATKSRSPYLDAKEDQIILSGQYGIIFKITTFIQCSSSDLESKYISKWLISLSVIWQIAISLLHCKRSLFTWLLLPLPSLSIMTAVIKLYALCSWNTAYSCLKETCCFGFLLVLSLPPSTCI